MFTGLVEFKGVVRSVSLKNGMTQLEVFCDFGSEPAIGDSIAINGCCLTVTSCSSSNCYTFDVSEETLSLTNLKHLSPKDVVNVERAMQVGDRLGGHLVSGHIDDICRLLTVKPGEQGCLLQVSISPNWAKYIISKGSVCLNGVSLTVNRLVDQVDETVIDLMLIPETLRATTFGLAKPGEIINLEVDMLAKFAERQRKFLSKDS